MKTLVEQSLISLINTARRGGDEPLDGDEVAKLAKEIEAIINLHEGNITEDEFNEVWG